MSRRPQTWEAVAPSVDAKRFRGAFRLVCVPEAGMEPFCAEVAR